MASTNSSEEVEQAVERLQAGIKAKHPDFKRIFIEASALTHHQTQAGGPAAMPA